MLADPVGNTVHRRVVSEIDCKAARMGERIAIELEPVRLATPRQASVRNDDVGNSTGGSYRRPVDPRSRARGQEPPLRRLLAEDSYACVMAAIARRLTVQNVRIAIEPR